ncbi:hypothetical protein LZ198_32140 [Myxococcus sp. K15C18031901]|uniref:hypothetical protein n=1 Tax=Myxococcus dinghuensis TaxID=2906761 RepID=UPI0020A77B1F|nr:hypothetical protein [Myxococcus dinghuensis]MCP3103544.1 hypothetical protein [Myxococcus dinghuensis]
MKKHFLLIAALSMPFLAGASEQSASAEASYEAQLVSEDPAASARLIPPLLQYCWDLDQDACTSVGSTQNCTDGIWTDYVCTCRSYSVFPTGTKRIWDCPEVR